MSVQTMLKKEKEGTLYKKTKLGSLLSDARETTLGAIENLKEDNRYTRALGDLETLKKAVPERAAYVADRFGDLRDRIGDVVKSAAAHKVLKDKPDVESHEKAASVLEATIRAAFLDELQKIAEASGKQSWEGDLSKFASNSVLEGLIKEALFKQLAGGLGQAAGGLKRMAVGGVTPTGIPVKGAFSGIQGTGARMKAFGQNMKTSPMQRIQAAGASPMEAQSIANQATSFGAKAPGVGKRIAGEAVEGAGAHLQHASPLKMAINPVGTVVGGGIEGATRGVGKELVRSTGLAGQAGAGGFTGSLGRGLQRAAPAAGVLGEIGTLGGLGGLAHVPLSGAGMVGGLAAKTSPYLFSGLSALGDVGGHIGADALGTAINTSGGVAGRRLLQRVGSLGGRMS